MKCYNLNKYCTNNVSLISSVFLVEDLAQSNVFVWICTNHERVCLDMHRFCSFDNWLCEPISANWQLTLAIWFAHSLINGNYTCVLMLLSYYHVGKIDFLGKKKEYIFVVRKETHSVRVNKQMTAIDVPKYSRTESSANTETIVKSKELRDNLHFPVMDEGNTTDSPTHANFGDIITPKIQNQGIAQFEGISIPIMQEESEVLAFNEQYPTAPAGEFKSQNSYDQYGRPYSQTRCRYDSSSILVY